MNNTEYLQYLQQRMGKVGDSGMKFLNARGLDRAFGGSQMQRGFNLEDIGNQSKLMDRRLNLAQDRSDMRTTNLARDVDTSYNSFKQAESDMDTAHVFDLMGLGTGYMQGQNQAEKEREMAEMLRRQTAAIEGITR